MKNELNSKLDPKCSDIFKKFTIQQLYLWLLAKPHSAYSFLELAIGPASLRYADANRRTTSDSFVFLRFTQKRLIESEVVL